MHSLCSAGWECWGILFFMGTICVFESKGVVLIMITTADILNEFVIITDTYYFFIKL